MVEEFSVEYNEGYEEPYFVKSSDWFFPVRSKLQADILCDKLNELSIKGGS